jgi:hypothetical protein
VAHFFELPILFYFALNNLMIYRLSLAVLILCEIGTNHRQDIQRLEGDLALRRRLLGESKSMLTAYELKLRTMSQSQMQQVYNP